VATLSHLPRVGETVDRYRVVAEVAHGGMAAVYAVQRSSIGGFEKLLALKVMLPHLASDAHFVDMFLDEAKIASQIQHPNVVRVLDVGLHERRPFILMEFLRGQSLSQLIQRAQKSTEPVLAPVWMAILAQAAEGLHAAHETCGSDGKPLGIVHRDVTPHNIFVGYDGQVTVVDFGVAAARGRASGTRTGEVKGKLAYLAPEQFDRSWPVTRATDVWALGVIAWEIFAGRRLFATGDEATTIWNVLNQPIERLDKLAPELPPAVARVIAACLSRQPDRRPATSKEIAAVLTSELGQNTATVGEIAAVMERLFGSERVLEIERLGAKPGAAPAPSAPPVPRLEGSAATQLSAAGTPRLLSRSKLGGAVLVVASGAALGAFLVGYGRRAADPTSEPANQVAAPSAFAVPTDARRTVSVRIDPRATLARASGTRHDERPLVLKLGPEDAVEIEVTGPSGEVVRRTVRSHDDGILIALDIPSSPVASAKKAPRRSGAPKPRPRAENPLLKNPF
jgi:eukaryotic-like serine/threonine-protein kinase